MVLVEVNLDPEPSFVERHPQLAPFLLAVVVSAVVAIVVVAVVGLP